MSINKVILVGNVGKDPEIRHLDSNISVANFSLATSESYTNKAGEKVTNTEWHNIVCWRSSATYAENYIRKGSQLYVEGKIKTRSYDAPDGSKRYVTEIYADSMQLLGKRTDGPSHVESPKATQVSTVNEPVDHFPYVKDDKEEDDLPF
ncbi:MAG: single-stranded DNA-binding protein [Mariniphaga sp.]